MYLNLIISQGGSDDYVLIVNNLYVERQLHFDKRSKLIPCEDDRKNDLSNILLSPNKTVHGYSYCQHVDVVKYSCNDFVAYFNIWSNWFWGYPQKCPVGDGGRRLS